MAVAANPLYCPARSSLSAFTQLAFRWGGQTRQLQQQQRRAGQPDSGQGEGGGVPVAGPGGRGCQEESVLQADPSPAPQSSGQFPLCCAAPELWCGRWCGELGGAPAGGSGRGTGCSRGCLGQATPPRHCSVLNTRHVSRSASPATAGHIPAVQSSIVVSTLCKCHHNLCVLSQTVSL